MRKRTKRDLSSFKRKIVSELSRRDWSVHKVFKRERGYGEGDWRIYKRM